MKSIALLQATRLLLATTVFGSATFLSPLVAHSSEEPSSAIGQRETQKLALADTTNAAVRNVNSLFPAMETRWQEVQQTVQPEILIKRSAEFRMDFPKSRYAQANRKIHAGAQKAFLAQQEAKLTSEAIEEPTGNQAYRDELIQAMRGSKESAYRVAKMYQKGTQGLPKDPHRTEQWMRIAAELGLGKASWEVANIYNRDGQMADAAKFETRAVRDGFVIPPRVPNRNIVGF
ncbi:MAG: hypothetical protein NTY05_10915 [Rhodocyclales bacterium]|nr:hypothetical protein [Rhodocyclales bacterium]